ncbi:hypothetical protein E1B28_010843 [Marasmius oreades]|uniref:Uncharacterized protein n=1 Tax=Marasmius oreades TaxID=181124 RepID=A0A9P7UPL3_9AGAR|nr:uncharacterized protein E1B28_010843 [Marasmius oreades]KAG7089135.1 hypothetical protein E1B28_010843 [Marasmius oreades]
MSTSTQSLQSLKEILMDVEQRVAQCCQLDEKYQDSEDRIEFSVRSDDVENVIDFLEEIPQSRVLRVNYDIVTPEARFSVRVAMPSLLYDMTATGWAELNRKILSISFPAMNYPQIFTSSLQTTYPGQNGGKSADTNIMPRARFEVGASRYPSVVLEVGYSETHAKLVRDVEQWLSQSPEILTVFCVKFKKNTVPLRGILQIWKRSNATNEPGVRCQLDFNLGMIDEEGYCDGLASQLRLYTHDYLMDSFTAGDAIINYGLRNLQPVVVDEMDEAGLIDKQLKIPSDPLKRWLHDLKMAVEMNSGGLLDFNFRGFGLAPPTHVQTGVGLRTGDFE